MRRLLKNTHVPGLKKAPRGDFFPASPHKQKIFLRVIPRMASNECVTRQGIEVFQNFRKKAFKADLFVADYS